MLSIRNPAKIGEMDVRITDNTAQIQPLEGPDFLLPRRSFLLASSILALNAFSGIGRAEAPRPLESLEALELNARSAPLLALPQYQALELGEKRALLEFNLTLREQATTNALLPLVQRSIGSEKENVLLTRDSAGSSFIELLTTLGSQPFHPVLHPERSDAIEGLITHLAFPGRLRQGPYGVCGTCFVYLFYRDHPAETLRLVTGLFSEPGTVKFRNGEELERSRFGEQAERTPPRTRGEGLFQSALMDYADGAAQDYCHVCDTHFDNKNGLISDSGLSIKQAQSIATAFYGEKFVSWNSSEKQSTLMRCAELAIPAPTEVLLSWRVATSSSRVNIERHYLQDKNIKEHSQQGHHYRQQGDGTKVPTRQRNHFVLVTDINDNRVFYRNPHGPSSLKSGSELKDPARRIEDAAEGIESMSRTDFQNRLLGVITSPKGHSAINENWKKRK